MAIQEGEQGLNINCTDHFEEKGYNFSSEEEVDSSDDSADFSVLESEDEVNAEGDLDGILESIPGLFENDQVQILTRARDQLCLPLFKLNQVSDLFLWGNTKILSFTGGVCQLKGIMLRSNY